MNNTVIYSIFHADLKYTKCFGLSQINNEIGVLKYIHFRLKIGRIYCFYNIYVIVLEMNNTVFYRIFHADSKFAKCFGLSQTDNEICVLKYLHFRLKIWINIMLY